ncbi:hypothetical protein O9993_05995 [Vibrio lentus]|nr:hypothetical protein [Vibrio lentus]
MANGAATATSRRIDTLVRYDREELAEAKAQQRALSLSILDKPALPLISMILILLHGLDSDRVSRSELEQQNQLVNAQQLAGANILLALKTMR